MRSIFYSLAIAVSCFSCSTMYFVHGNQPSASLENEEWHHDGIFGLIEFSPPVDLNERCPGREWQTIKIEKSFLNGLAGAAVDAIFAIPVATTSVDAGFVAVGETSYLVLPVYDPWMVSFSCRKKP